MKDTAHGKTRALSVFLALVLALGLMPLPAFAAQSEGGGQATKSAIGFLTTHAEEDLITAVKFNNAGPIDYNKDTHEFTFAYPEGSSGTGNAIVTFAEGATVTMTFRDSRGTDQEVNCVSNQQAYMGSYVVANGTLYFTLTATKDGETQVYKCTIKRTPRVGKVTVTKPDGTALSFSGGESYVPTGIDKVTVNASSYVATGVDVFLNGTKIESGSNNELTCDYDANGVFSIVVKVERDGLYSESTYKVIRDAELPADALGGGKCGENLKWYVTPAGVLTIHGSGAMNNYSGGTAPWMSLYNSINTIQIGDGVTTIGNYAFSAGPWGSTHLSKIKRIVIPNSVTSIGSGAFQSMPNLTSVSLGSGVETIGASAFQNTALKSFVIPEQVKQLGSSSFYGCARLTSVEIYAGDLTVLGTAHFQNCTSLTEVYLGRGVKTLGNNMFNGCKALTDVTYEAAVAVPNNAFQNCSALTSIVLPEGVDSIGNYAFSGCTSLQSITLSSTLTAIGEYAFQNCATLKAIQIPNSVTTLGARAFQNCSAVTSLSLGNGVKEIPNYAFDGCSSLKELTIPDQVTSIGEYAFRNLDAITSVVIPSSVTTLEKYAFRNCDELTSVEIKATDVELNGYQFMECPKLVSIKTAGALKTDETGIIYSEDGKTLILCPATFEGEAVIPAGVTEIADAAFAGCASLTKVTMPTTLTKVGENAFQNCTALTSADLPASVKEIGSGIFENCSALENLPSLGGITEVPAYMFYNCGKLTTVSLPNTITAIGDRAFSYCSELTAIDLPEKLQTMGQYIFAYCQALESIDIPATVSIIPNYAFYYCTSLSDVALHEGLTSINASAFANTALEYIDIPEGVTSLGNYSLGYNRIVPKTVILPASLAKIDQFYTFGTTDLKYIAQYVEHFYYRGTDDQFQALLAASGNYQAAVRYTNCPVTYLYDSKGAAPELTAVPTTVNIAASEDAKNALSVTVAPIPEDSTLTINWYKKNADGSFNKVESTVDNLTGSATPATDTVGIASYFAVATLTAKDGSQGCVVTDDVRVLVGVDFPSGDGSQEHPFELATAKDIATLKTFIDLGMDTRDTFFQMSADITLPDGWTELGTFAGTFDGNDHTITVPAGSKPLFSVLSAATVKNLSIYGTDIDGNGLVSTDLQSKNTLDAITIKEGSNVRGSGLVSSTAGSANGAVITNCTVERNVKIGWDSVKNEPAEQITSAGYYSDSVGVGSFAGSLNGTLINCVSYADVYGKNVVGGILGRQAQSMSSNRIINCEFHGNIHATGINVGGICGAGYIAISAPNGSCISIQNCLVTGSVAGADYIGGIFGGEGNSKAGVEEAWSNGVGYVTDNLFTGTLTASDDAVAVGGIIGYMRGINAYNVIENNYYQQECGAKRGIGQAYHVDTSAVPYGIAEDGTFYFNTAVDDLYEIYLIVDGIEDAFRSVTGTAGAVRSDDPYTNPLVTAATTEASLKDGTTAKALNEGAYSLGNWTTTDSATAHRDGAFITNLELMGDYKTEYVIGEDIDTSNMVIIATYSDGTVKDVPAQECTFTLDTSTPGTKTVVVSYESARTTFTALVTADTTNYDQNLKGTVYISVSNDARYAVSSGDEPNVVLSYVPVDLAELAQIKLEDYGLGNYRLVATDANAGYRYDVNVLQLFVYAQTHFSADGADGLEVSGTPGSLLIEQFMGHDRNFNYYVNGAYPMKPGKPGIGATCDEIPLSDGDFVDVAMFTSYDFNNDPAAGFHFFVDNTNAITHSYQAVAGEAFNVSLGRIYETTDGIAPEASYPLRWGTQEDWNAYYGVGSTTRADANAGTTVTTDASGKAAIEFPSTGTYYLWADGARGVAAATTNSYVSGPAYATVEVITRVTADAQDTLAQAQAALDEATSAQARADEALAAAQAETDPVAKAAKIAEAQTAATVASIAADKAVEAATAAEAAANKALAAATTDSEIAAATQLATNVQTAKKQAVSAKNAATEAKAAADEEAKASARDNGTDITNAQVSVANTTYTGKALTPAVTVKLNNKNLVATTDYTVNYLNNKTVGTGIVIVKGKGSYTGSAVATFTIAKAKGEIVATAKAAKKAATVKAGKTLGAKKYVKVTKKTSALTYKLVKAPKKIKKYLQVNAKNGKIKVKKGARKGTYALKIKLSAASSENYGAAFKTITVKLKVK